jgi:hypothetical protein
MPKRFQEEWMESEIKLTNGGARSLAYAVLKSGINSRDKLFFESGMFRFYMDLLDFGTLSEVWMALRPLAAKEGWKLPSYPMKVKKEAANGK